MNASLFIIESLRFKDESEECFEGRILHQVLRLARKEVRYFYVRTRKELQAVLRKFNQSRMRYLHISCHGSPDAIALTLDNLSFREFASLVNPYLPHRRLFFSACEVVNSNLAKLIIPQSGCYSVIGPREEVSFADAALMWSSFYHLMFRLNPDAMKGADIRGVLAKICPTFEVPFLYYRSSKSDPRGYKKYAYGPTYQQEIN